MVSGGIRGPVWPPGLGLSTTPALLHHRPRSRRDASHAVHGSLEAWCCVTELHTIIYCSLAADELERTEFPFVAPWDALRAKPPWHACNACAWMLVSHVPGLGEGCVSGWDVVKWATRASHRLCNAGQFTMTCQNICKISISQMQSIKSVKLRGWPIN